MLGNLRVSLLFALLKLNTALNTYRRLISISLHIFFSTSSIILLRQLLVLKLVFVCLKHLAN